jgi:hypothetical protein
LSAFSETLYDCKPTDLTPRLEMNAALCCILGLVCGKANECARKKSVDNSIEKWCSNHSQ